MLLASYSTVFKARARRTALVYEIVAGILIVSDSNLVLGVAEFVIFQVMVIFSVIASLYAYAGIKISEKEKESTALIVLPVKKQEVEVDMDTVVSMQNLAYSVFCICLGVLILIRPALLFPFYGKNWALFTVSLLIVTLNFWIASTRLMPRAADSISKEMECLHVIQLFSLTIMSLIAFITVQFITAIIFLVLNEDTQKNVTTQIPTYSVMSPISEHYDYKEDLPSYIRDHIVEIDDNIYLIKYDYHDDNSDKYYLNLGDPDLLCITDTGSWQKVSVHVKGYDGPYNTPCIEKTEKTYTNLRGETKVLETIYDIYIQDEEQILTY